MNRDYLYNYGFARNMKDIEEHIVPSEVVHDDVIDVVTSSDSFISLVYAIDPIYKVPRGDLQYMVSDKANPEVKKWVLDNLLFDTSPAAMPAAPRGLSDDDVALLARRPSESSQSYVERVNSFLESNKQAYERLVNTASELQKQSVSSQSE